MRALLTLLCASALSTVASLPVRAAESDYFWVTGWGMGVLEAQVTSGEGNRILVACDGGGHRYTGITFTLNGQQPTGQVYLDFGYGPEDIWAPDGHIATNSHAGAGTFEWVVERLKRHSEVRVAFENGDSAVFTLRGSSAAIGECPPDFAY